MEVNQHHNQLYVSIFPWTNKVVKHFFLLFKIASHCFDLWCTIREGIHKNETHTHTHIFSG